MENNDIEKVFKIADLVKTPKIENDLLKADDLLNQNLSLKGINKIELMGGKHPFRQDFLNIDKLAEQGVQGSVLEISKFIKPNSNSDMIIVINNSYSKEMKPELFLSDLLGQIKEMTHTQKVGQTTYVIFSGTPNNPFFNKIEKIASKVMNQQEGWKMLTQEKVPSSYQSLQFFTTNGQEIDKNRMKLTLFIKRH